MKLEFTVIICSKLGYYKKVVIIAKKYITAMYGLTLSKDVKYNRYYF